MELGGDARIEEHEDVVVREVHGEAVLLHMASELYYVLDEPSTRIWRVLVDSATLSEAVTTLGSEFDVRPDVLRRDLTRFVGELVERGLVRVHDPS